MTEALDKLIAAVEAGNLQDQPYFGMSMATACYPRDAEGRIVDGSGWSDAAVMSAYHGSLDAALRLHDALLPGWEWMMGNKGTVAVIPPERMFAKTGIIGPTCRIDKNPARAWLLAILRALKATTDALPPHQQATFAAMMGQRERLKPDADGLVPVRKENGDE